MCCEFFLCDEWGACSSSGSCHEWLPTNVAPPGPPLCKVNVDASWCVNTKSGKIGVVIRDHLGDFLTAKRDNISALTVAMEEALAVLGCCSFARELGLPQIMVESDSLEVISCLQGPIHLGSWEGFLTLTKITQMGESFQVCRWTWIPRSANMAVDKLASRNL